MERIGNDAGQAAQLRTEPSQDYETRRLLTMAAMRIFDLWKLTNQQKLQLLDYSIRCSPLIRRYRRGAVIQKNSRALSRIRLLMVIYRQLNKYFPDDPEGMRRWLLASHTAFKGRRPLDVMCQSSCEGFAKVLKVLSEAQYQND